ncbi:hypothetical protein QYE76_002097 [Lolium multiflorum]|uniref:Protein kinase domain-containing protein n=1 Tax=Lolium multiflorum TaxID=4521 RepID=A0AAD8VXY5_LOLMU|nr:hypothetical protein QYE76_002097 [Lolium multiflorum]
MDTSLGDVQFALKKMQITDEFDDEGAIDYQEPREVTIFSALKDSRIVTFIQAWACDGLYKTYLERSDAEEYDVCEDGPDLRYVIIQMNICSRTLEQLLPVGEGRAINVEVAWIIFTEITKALNYIHQNGVIHRDLKPGNIFFLSHDTYQVMIGDFGHSCWSKQYVDGKKGTPLRGTQLYAAPELDDTASDHTDKADIYSLGVILVEMFHSFTTGQEKGQVLIGLSKGKYPTKWEGDTVLLKRLTASSPSDRPSATEILDYMAKRQ